MMGDQRNYEMFRCLRRTIGPIGLILALLSTWVMCSELEAAGAPRESNSGSQNFSLVDWALPGQGKSVRYGEQVELDLSILVEDDFYLDESYTLLSFAGRDYRFPVAELQGSDVKIGAVLNQKLVFYARPLPTRNRPLPFLDHETYSASVRIRHDRGGVLMTASLSEFVVEPIISATDVVCLTNNADLPMRHRVSALKSISFPDGPPTMNPSVKGTVVKELTDGLFGKSGYPAWETVYWRGGTDAKERRVLLLFNRPIQVLGIVAICPSAFPNYRVDRITVEVARANEGFELFGSSVPLIDSGLLRSDLITGQSEGTEQIQMTFAQDPGATDIVISEVYVFGR